MNTLMEVCNVGLQILLVVVPCHTIDADRCRRLQIEEGVAQAVFVDVMQQGSEPELAVLAGSFTHAVQTE
ncbi:MAG: hypothetical protein O2856_05090 [Planctomycetota bacterium]|nr:hypothetical protein [Planctomycetota bacterium]